MNFKQLFYSPNNVKPAENTAFDKNVGSKSLDLSGAIAVIGKASENHFMLRLQEMEELNSSLEKLVEQRTKKLNEVVATNTKFLSIIAHDLRNPFSSILGVLEILKARVNEFNKNEIENYVDIAYNSDNGIGISFEAQ